MSRVSCLDHGYVELIGSMGGDIDVVNGARQSFDDVSIAHFPMCQQVIGSEECDCGSWAVKAYNFSDLKHLSKKDAGLINFLMRERHTSPFELVTAKFAVQLPIFVAREWMRHRTQSFNEMSGRYTQLPRLFYVPGEIREQTGKPGAYKYVTTEDHEMSGWAKDSIEGASNAAFNAYEDMLEAGVAKEQARLVLPVNTYTKFVVSANLLNWMRFLSLRNHPHAQQEIQEYARAIEEQLIAVAPVAMQKFVEHGRLQ